MELCLGTVQFGMKYGVNNVLDRQPTWEESFEMLDYAIANGINFIDTARAYGEAEIVLGEYLKNHSNDNLHIISKLRPNIVNSDEKDVYGVLVKEIEESLRRLNIDRLDGYLLHTPEYIYVPEIVSAMIKIKEKGYVEHLGISIYDVKEGMAAIDIDAMDYIQMPYSILDQRGKKEDFFKVAKRRGVKVFTRSAFLQGLFMMPKETIPKHLNRAIPYLDVMNSILEKYQVDKVSAIIEFVKYESEIDYLVFGVEKLEQLQEDLLKFKQQEVPEACILELKEQINNVEQSIIFPSLWSNGKKAE